MALTVKIRADASHFKKTIAGVEVQASGLVGVMGKLATSNLAFGAALSVAAAGAVALGAGLAFIKDASGKAAGMESLIVQFEVLTKSADKAQELIKSFREEAIKSPLSVEDYAQAAQKMLTVGTSFEKVLPTLKMVGDVSMGSSLKFERLALAYSQIISKGRLMGQENNQLAESGFAPLAEISKRTGESMAQLMKRMETTGITSDEVTQAFKDATSAGGLFFGALDRGASTTTGKIAKFNDAIVGLKVSFGTGFNEGLKSALDAVNAFLPQLEEKFQQLGDFFGQAIKDAIEEDFALFEKLGVFIGESVFAGLMTVIEQFGPRMAERFSESKMGSFGPIGGATKVVGKLMSGFDGPTPIRETLSNNSGRAKDALEDLIKTYDQKSGNNEELTELKKGRTATETLVMLYRNAEARRERGKMFSR